MKPMKKAKTKIGFFAALLLAFFCFSGNSETFAGRHIFSLDFGYLHTGFKNNGWGLGFAYEIQCFDFLSVRPKISNMMLWPKNYDVVVTTFGTGCDVLFYPFFQGLEGPYLGGGIGMELMMFKTPLPLENEIALTATPILGWKFSIFDYVFLDAFFGYRILMNEKYFSSDDVAKSYRNKFKWGIKFKINLKKIFGKIKGD